MSNFCPNCGAELEQGAAFCASCGSKMEETAPAAETPNVSYEEAESQATYSESYYEQSVEPVNEPEQPKGMAIGSMVCGILSLVCCCFDYLSVILAIVALVLGIIVLVKKQGGKGMAIAGIVCGGIGFIFGISSIIIGLVMKDQIMDYLSSMGINDFDDYMNFIGM